MSAILRMKKELLRKKKLREIGMLVDLPPEVAMGDVCELIMDTDDKWYLVGYNQGGFDCVSFSVEALIAWLRDNKPELLEVSV